MNDQLDIYRLVLLPERFDQGVQDIGQFLKGLDNIGLIGDSIDNKASSYLVGEQFFSHLSFLGCSPYISLEPQDSQDSNFCHIRIVNTKAPVFYSGRHTRIPSCPVCKSPLEYLSKQLGVNSPMLPEDIWVCEACGQQGKMHELNWRKTAGFTRIAIEVWSVHPHEAVPNSFLLGTLDEMTGMKWRYIYC